MMPYAIEDKCKKIHCWGKAHRLLEICQNTPERTPAKGFKYILIEGDSAKVEEVYNELASGAWDSRNIGPKVSACEYRVEGVNASAGVFNCIMVSQRLTSTKLLMQHDCAGHLLESVQFRLNLLM